jgi:hypothetical protein
MCGGVPRVQLQQGIEKMERFRRRNLPSSLSLALLLTTCLLLLVVVLKHF